MNEQQADRVGELYGEAMTNFDRFGEFQLALSTAMHHRSYDTDIDEFERVLRWFIEAGVDRASVWSDPQYRQLHEIHHEEGEDDD